MISKVRPTRLHWGAAPVLGTKSAIYDRFCIDCVVSVLPVVTSVGDGAHISGTSCQSDPPGAARDRGRSLMSTIAYFVVQTRR